MYSACVVGRARGSRRSHFRLLTSPFVFKFGSGFAGSGFDVRQRRIRKANNIEGVLNQFRRSVILTSIALSIPACALFVVGDGAIRAEGTLSDSTGRPVSDALVFFDTPSRRDYPSSFETRSGSDGHFNLGTTVAPGRYNIRLIVSAAGYRDATLAIPTLQPNKLQVTLERNDSQNASSIRRIANK